MKGCPKCLPVKTYEKHKKASRADLIKKRFDVLAENRCVHSR